MAAANSEIETVDESLERPVAVEGDDRTVDTFNFTTYDAGTGFGALLTMNSLPGDPTMWRGAVLAFHPSGDLLLAKGFGRSPDGPGNGNLAYACRAPFRRWDLHFEGFAHRAAPAELTDAMLRDGPEEPLAFDLAFDSVMPAWGHVSDGEVAGTHYEQNGFVRGSWRWAGETFAHDGVGFRDRIVGPKATDLLQRHNWIHGTMRDGRAFALTIVSLRTDPATRLGSACVVEAGRIHDATVVAMPMRESVDEVPAPMQIVLATERGETTVELEPLQTARWMYVSSPHVRLQPALFGHDRARSGALLLWESPARVQWGDDVGYGHIEQSLVVP